jgi:hypothetical protein
METLSTSAAPHASALPHQTAAERSNTLIILVVVGAIILTVVAIVALTRSRSPR